MPAIKLVIEIPRGNGSTTLATKFAQCLENTIKKDPSLSSKTYTMFIDKSGKFLVDHISLNNMKMIPIIILDGVPNPDTFPMESKNILMSFINNSSVFCFTEDKSQSKILFTEEPFILKAEPFTPENILEMAKENGYIADTKESLDATKLRIKKLLEKDTTPKSILNILTATSGLPLKDYTDFHKSVEPSVVEHVFENVVANHTEISSFESVPLNKLHSFISSKVLGQEEAINQVVNSIAFVQYGLTDKTRPVYSFMFLGKTGTGKTELCRTLSKGLFGREDIVRIDMGEFKSSHHVEKLFGAPQGYIGHGQNTKLVRELKKKTKGVLLFDEIEKAHRDVHDALLNILDAGKFSTGTGELIDLTGYIVVMTSNALVKEEAGMNNKIGFTSRTDKIGESADIRKKLVQKEYFSAEFVNRINSVIWFNDISEEICRKILEREFGNIKEALTDRGITFTYSQNYVNSILKKCEKDFGGRDVIRKADLARFEVVDRIRKDASVTAIHLDVESSSSSLERAKSLLQ
jgi:ATP-dependent Clp protease ATP-binding subunit ClpA